MKQIVTAAVTALAVLSVSDAAFAYCRTASCPGGVTGAQCVPAQAGDCGVLLAWPSPCVQFWIQEDASNQVTLAQAETVFTAAFQAWTGAACGSGTPGIRATYGGPVACTEHEYNQQAGNANIIVFRDAEWPHPSKSTLALTTVTYNLDTGDIYDADMELNSATVTFTVSDSSVQYDLLSVATHEAGHFLGLSHSVSSAATMRPDYIPQSTMLRDLDSDDIAAICDAYPPANVPASCDDTPRHGFSGLCAADQPTTTETEDCAFGRNEGSRGVWLSTLGLLVWTAVRRSKQRRSR